MGYCKQCVISDSRPGIKFDDKGVCHPCRFAEAHKNVDWDKRKNALRAIAEWGRKRRSHGYDCIVTVSGGKDSTRQALYARDELGLKPLLVSCTYPPEQQIEIGAKNIANLISLGFDAIIVGPGSEKWRVLMRNAFYRFGNWAKATEMALYAIPPRVAISYQIPLILLGENNVIISGDLGDSFGGEAHNVKNNNTLAGGDPSVLLGNGIELKDILWHKFPSDEEVARANIRMIYMGFYIEDFNPYVNAAIALNKGLTIRDVQLEDIGALNIHEDLDEDFVHVNQLLKYLKLGFARATDDASIAIRAGRLKREEAVELVNKYDGRCAKRYIVKFCDYIGIDEDEFWRVAESFRNKDIWEKDANNEWILKDRLN